MSRSVDFDVDVEDIYDMFTGDNIREGKSLDKIIQWGNVQGMKQLFATNYKVILFHQLGIDSATIDARKQAFGDNLPILKQPKTFLELILENFEDQILRLLCYAAVVSLILGILSHGIKQGWLQGVSILIAVVIIVSVTSINNYMKQAQFRKLNQIAAKKFIYVWRDGKKIHLDSSQLLVGDICQIQTGEILGVDGILIKGHDVCTDQSAITGQSDLIKKCTPQEDVENESPFLISGSMIMQGTGIMMVSAVGKNSQYGRLKMKIQQDPDPTPLQQKLTILAQQIGDIGFYSALATFIAMFTHFIYDCFMSGETFNYFLSYQTINQMVEYFIISVSIVVVAVPEGLPLAVTIALAYSVGKMLKENNLVRYLQACQTMGGANNICTDKTGTLTQNKMSVTRILIQQNAFSKIQSGSIKSQINELLSYAVCSNSSATPKVEGSKFTQVGNKTQCALLEMAFKLGFSFEKLRKSQNIIKVFPFSSARKKMSTIYEMKKGEYKLFTKGAPDFILEKCKYFINRQGKQNSINKQFLGLLNSTMSAFASQSLRNILIAYRDLDHNQINLQSQEIQNDFIIIAMVGIKDPLRDQIAYSVQQCHEAGVIVRMVTGDNKQTAVAIAKEAGILDKNWKYDPNSKKVMEGKQFRQFVKNLIKTEESEKVGDIQNFKIIDKELRVLARSSPQDKYIMALGLKQLNNVVAMTGDGANDAPALKKADIGFAMGIAGTQIAKEAAGIILLDDNFKSIVTAIKWGRNIFQSIRKFIQFQLTVNFVAIVMAFLGGAILRESPLNAIQMLWVNLIMDTLASLSLATEEPTDQLLKRKPYSRFESLITPQMWKNIIFQSLFQIIILCVLLFKGPELLGIPSSINVADWNNQTGKHYAIFFHIFVLLQLFNEINARKLKPDEINVFEGFFSNFLYILIGGAEFVTQVAIVQFGGKAVKCVPLTFHQHLFCFLIGTMSLYFGYIIKVLIPFNLVIQTYKIEFGPLKYQWGKPQQQQTKQD